MGLHIPDLFRVIQGRSWLRCDVRPRYLGLSLSLRRVLQGVHEPTREGILLQTCNEIRNHSLYISLDIREGVRFLVGNADPLATRLGHDGRVACSGCDFALPHHVLRPRLVQVCSMGSPGIETSGESLDMSLHDTKISVF